MNSNSNNFGNAMTTEMDRIKNLRDLIRTTLKKVAYEEEHKITYNKLRGCDKDNFRRIFKIYYTFMNIRNKEVLQQSIYMAIYVLWNKIDKSEKDNFLEDSKNPSICNNFANVEETFEAFDLISKWIRLNSLIEDESLPYLIYSLDSIPEMETNETNLMLLPKINSKIKEINKSLATFPQDINLMKLLYELIVMFHKLKDNSTKLDSQLIKIIYGTHYYRNIYSAIILFWNFIQVNVPGIDKHPNYPYIVMNMYVLEKTHKQNKLMDKITRTTLKNIKSIIPKRVENVNKLRNADLFALV
jgi:hypothetical protein